MAGNKKVILELKNLVKNYGGTAAVKGISLQVYRGEVFGFLGPNGAGKTTTIKCCTGLLRPSAGRVTVGGFDIVGRAAAAKALMGYVPDTPFLYEKLTGREFVRFVARLYGADPAGLEKKIDGFFSLFEMTEQMDELIQGYSSGMRQKTALIAALLHQPALLMVDEPTANLDPKSARLVKNIFQSFKEQGRTVFLSTHVMEIAENLCDRIAIIHRGELRTLGSMEELRRLRRGESLEDIFLELTGGHDPETEKILAELSGQGGAS